MTGVAAGAGRDRGAPLAGPPRRDAPRHRYLALTLASGAGGTALSWIVAQHSLVGARWTMLALLAAWVPLWVVGSWAAGRMGGRRLALGAILVVALALRLAALSGTTPSISSDLYRYGWDAHVQLSGIDPYRYPPDAPQLARLREAPWWPDPKECAHLRMHSGCTTINRPDVRTIYPGAAEGWYALVGAAAGGRAGSRPFQLAGGLADMATVGLLAVALRRGGRDPAGAAWYAFSPVAVVELTGNGHVDGFALLLLVGALLALERQRRGLAGVLIGLATMVKLYPGAALVAGYRRGGPRMILSAALTCVAVELPHLLAVGSRLLGYLPGYLSEENYSSGGRFLLLGMLGLPPGATTVLALGCLLASLAWAWRGDRSPAASLAGVLAVLILVTTPVQPWYAVAGSAIGLLVDAGWLVLLPLAGEVYYAAVVLDGPPQLRWGRAAYGLAAVGTGVALLCRRRARHHGAGHRREAGNRGHPAPL